MALDNLPPHLVEFLEKCIPTLEAVEVLLFLSARPGRPMLPAEISAGLEPLVIPLSETEEYLQILHQHGLLRQDSAGGFEYSPVSESLRTTVSALESAYHERPVSLIRAIYPLQRE